ncbi:hypothetical protein M514_21492 [Trichuris suis]|uniref:Uncharacterized protein n=1 Tax=Trichuris suis TaxID=68888 RepID=A0A085N9Q9_9BILA|nr:hypothetical protein M514_21492 [Trichuris suis]
MACSVTDEEQRASVMATNSRCDYWLPASPSTAAASSAAGCQRVSAFSATSFSDSSFSRPRHNVLKVAGILLRNDSLMISWSMSSGRLGRIADASGTNGR